MKQTHQIPNVRYAAVLLMFAAASPPGFAQSDTSQPSTLPVYDAVRSGATETQLKQLADSLKIPAEQLLLKSGTASFVDADKYLYVPHIQVSDAATAERLRSAPDAQRPDVALRLEAIDFDALSKLAVAEPELAVKSGSAAFAAADISLQGARPVVGHTTFTASYINDSGAEVSVDKALDTRVSYEFSGQGGIPIIGPGAQAQISFDPSGKVTQLRYAASEWKPGAMVKIVPESAMRDRIARHLPATAQLKLKLVYWAPSLEAGPGRDEPVAAGSIIPWYAYSIATPLSDRATGQVSQVRSKVQMIPATDDPRYVPSARLAVSGRSSISAQVTVRGGRAPYTYIWSGSGPQLSASSGSEVRYTPMVRAVPRAVRARQTRTLVVSETVSVTVIDANGVMTRVSQTLPALAQIASIPLNDLPGPVEKGPPPSYGTQSPREPDFAIDRVGWQQGMSTAGAGGGSQKYAWLGASSWPGDFIAHAPAGTLPATPWVYGDADYANWGVDTATIALNNTDGAADGFAASQPGAVIANYATAQLFVPSTKSSTVVVGQVHYGDVAGTHYYNVNYDGSWGPSGKNHYLMWLAMDACDILDAQDGSGQTPGQRWGKAFGGLHIMTGWDSEESVGDGSFEKDFARNMLGVSGKPQTVLQAWFNAATTAGTDHGVAAAMGPIGPGGVDDKNDFYIGKGTQGPTILPANIKGFWYVHQ